MGDKLGKGLALTAEKKALASLMRLAPSSDQ